ncbi:Late embryogenesis abundant protein, LEA-14 [Corchorus olitorius]|uniref:Late embryogenesis abundant protein, LEA-14 n=1 Tax=Corchorus olitorius TaxID=93759 RepID=A0A1R3JFX6_9ROSI|nr:Late embryogenesis abundant protein, LEA-14 [Corchorus olitorius]
MPSKFSSGPEKRTSPLVWFAAIICTILTLAVIIAGIVTFIGYLVIHPRVPFVSVVGASLDRLLIDYAGILEIQVTVVIRAHNGNENAHASFSESSYFLSLDGKNLAQLVAGPFEVSKNNSVDFNYVAVSKPIPLDPEEAEDVDLSIKNDRITFDLKGGTKARWRVGPLGSVRFSCNLNCQLHFHALNGTYIPSRCTSKAK